MNAVRIGSSIRVSHSPAAEEVLLQVSPLQGARPRLRRIGIVDCEEASEENQGQHARILSRRTTGSWYDIPMNLRKLVGIVLLTLGTAMLVWRGFTYTSEKHEAHLGPIDFQVKEKKRVYLPTWSGVLAIIAGAALLVVPARRLDR